LRKNQPLKKKIFFFLNIFFVEYFVIFFCDFFLP
jgi:hypothetical protein